MGDEGVAGEGEGIGKPTGGMSDAKHNVDGGDQLSGKVRPIPVRSRKANIVDAGPHVLERTLIESFTVVGWATVDAKHNVDDGDQSSVVGVSVSGVPGSNATKPSYSVEISRTPAAKRASVAATGDGGRWPVPADGRTSKCSLEARASPR